MFAAHIQLTLGPDARRDLFTSQLRDLLFLFDNAACIEATSSLNASAEFILDNNDLICSSRASNRPIVDCKVTCRLEIWVIVFSICPTWPTSSLNLPLAVF